MNDNQQISYQGIISDFKTQIGKWLVEYPGLTDQINELIKLSPVDYSLENSIVYNHKLDEIKKPEKVKYILVADNPGKSEQLNINQYYLMGQAGVLTRNFFEQKKLVDNFDQEVIVLNKTPVHTRATADLRKLKEYRGFLKETQVYMAKMIFDLHNLIKCKLWIVGYSELKKGKIFDPFRLKLIDSYQNLALKEDIGIFKHFSFNQFRIDYNKEEFNSPKLSPLKITEKIGSEYRKIHLGW